MYVTSIKIYKKTKQNNYMVKTKNPQSIKKLTQSSLSNLLTIQQKHEDKKKCIYKHML